MHLGRTVPQKLLGVSDYLEAGSHEHVPVTLDRPLESDNVTVIAMAHQDTNGNQAFDYALSNQSVDGPYTQSESAGANETPTQGVETETPETGTATPEGGNVTDGDATRTPVMDRRTREPARKQRPKLTGRNPKTAGDRSGRFAATVIPVEANQAYLLRPDDGADSIPCRFVAELSWPLIGSLVQSR